MADPTICKVKRLPPGPPQSGTELYHIEPPLRMDVHHPARLGPQFIRHAVFRVKIWFDMQGIA